MKKLAYLFVLLFWLCVASAFGQNSWINVQLLTDNYPEETSWNITPPGGFPIIAQSDSNLEEVTFYSDTILVGGDIVISLIDDFGDGLGGSQWSNGVDGWFLIQNDCQDTIFYASGDFGSILVDTLTIAPCAPPTIIDGCTDPIALNYDSIANVDNGTCEYIEGCMNPNASNYNPLAGQLPTGLITPGATCNLVEFTNTHFGVDTADYFADPSIWQVGTRIYEGESMTQWFVDVVVVESPFSCMQD